MYKRQLQSDVGATERRVFDGVVQNRRHQRIHVQALLGQHLRHRDRMGAVSYTHLDVYKRQVLRPMRGKPVNPVNPTSPIPVSYTHLDVYKRQVLRLRSAGGGDALQVDDALLARLGDLAQRLDARFPRLQVQFTELLQFPGVVQARGVDADAVSYTHLDVYKRQIVALACMQNAAFPHALRDQWQRVVGVLQQRQHTHKAVSYTHLDVYKRQVLKPGEDAVAGGSGGALSLIHI